MKGIATCMWVLTFTWSSHAANPNDFVVRNYDLNIDGNIDLHGRLFVPDNYDPQQQYPLVVFYHGLGEVGTDNTSQVNGNINKLLTAAKNRDFFLYAPQTPNNWAPIRVEQSMNIAAGIAQDYAVDTDRIYLTGLSLGGGAARAGVSLYHEAIAATLPIAAVGGNTSPENLVGEPLWVHHAVNDGTVSVNVSRGLVNAIRQADGGKPALNFPLNANPAAPYYNTGQPFYSDGSTYYNENRLRYTEFDGGGHGIWGRVYADDNVYDWMFDQTQSIPALATGQSVGFDFGGIARVDQDTAGLTWNATFTGEEKTTAVAVPFAKATSGTRTTVTLNVSTAFNFETTWGLTSTNSSFDPDVAIDSWATDRSTVDPALLTISGLTPGQVYRVTCFGSHVDDDDGRGRVTRYRINGDWRDLNVAGNVDDMVVFNAAAADAWGEIVVEVGVPEGSSSRYAFINALTVTAVPEPTSAGFVAGAILWCLSRRPRRGEMSGGRPDTRRTKTLLNA